jgi:hypothetical protein
MAREVTPTLISTINGAPLVRNPVYPWPVDYFPARVDIVECFIEGRPHQMELEKDGSFQMSDFSNEVWCIYHILASWILPVISHMIITMERARCLYTLLTKAPIDFGPLITCTMMSVWLTDKGVALSYEAQVTQIAKHAEVLMARLRQTQLERGPMGLHFLNAS